MNTPRYYLPLDLRKTSDVGKEAGKRKIRLSLLQNACKVVADRFLNVMYIACGGAALSWALGAKIVNVCGLGRSKNALVSSRLIGVSRC
ncbi:MAG: hypothetical protein EOP48_21545 [Sphingobacteriales bacterium]|nr:MAG: hypothetical protein EOP48_21545 [Sphingobacteriales bacterium]